jgi:hypothetical protein
VEVRNGIRVEGIGVEVVPWVVHESKKKKEEKRRLKTRNRARRIERL